MKNIGTAIAAFLISGGYLVAINWLQKFQGWVRTIPTDYVLTPLVLLLVIVVTLWKINRKQRKQLSQIQQQPQVTHADSRFVTHYGVWWKLYPEAEHIEDFPYCPCCEPRKKLVQLEWYPDEVFKCPTTGTQVKLFDGIPRKLRDILGSLYGSYFGGEQLENRLGREFRRLKELHPDKDEMEVLRLAFAAEPFDRIPKEELSALFTRFANPLEIILFLSRNYQSYLKYLRKAPKS